MIANLLRRVLGRVDVAQRLAIPAQRKPVETYVPPACARLLTTEERAHIDWLIRALTS